ncbi:MAG TPA: hypothetical protein VL945_01110 [Candidatus Saccharimonadales bacterium]|nr:hypothetical protein [Candidatus Saccharimonadales bacterium]
MKLLGGYAGARLSGANSVLGRRPDASLFSMRRARQAEPEAGQRRKEGLLKAVLRRLAGKGIAKT